jgi:hypothetical protein
MNGLLDGWRIRSIFYQEGIRVCNRSQTSELLLDYMLLPRRRRWCLPPQLPRVRWPSIEFACYSLSPIPEECFVLHVTVSIEFRFPFTDLKNLFSCMLQSPHTLFISSVHFENVTGLIIFALLLGAIATGNFCWEMKQKTPFKLFFSYEKESFRCLFERWKTFENLLQRKEKLYNERYNNRFNHGFYRTQGIHFDYATPVLRENVNVHVQTLDKKNKNKFLSPPSTWAWSEQPTSLTVLWTSERCTTTKSCVPTFTSTNNILNTRKRYYLYARNWNSKWNE